VNFTPWPRYLRERTAVSDEWEAMNESFTFCRSPVLEHSEHLQRRALKEVYFVVIEYVVQYVYM